MKRPIEYATETARALVESLESNDGMAPALLNKLVVQVRLCYDFDNDYDVSDFIDLAAHMHFMDGDACVEPSVWTHDEVKVFARACVGLFE